MTSRALLALLCLPFAALAADERALPSQNDWVALQPDVRVALRSHPPDASHGFRYWTLHEEIQDIRTGRVVWSGPAAESGDVGDVTFSAGGTLPKAKSVVVSVHVIDNTDRAECVVEIREGKTILSRTTSIIAVER